MACSKEARSIEKLTECPICLEDLKDPRILPCLHSLCFLCLHQYAATSTTGGATISLCCPSCRKPCQVPAGGIQDFPKNFFVNSLQECLRKIDLDPSDVTGCRAASSAANSLGGATADDKVDQQCPNSNRAGTHGQVVVFCLECDHYFCQTCSDSHSLFDATRGHELTPVKCRPEASSSVPGMSAELKKRGVPHCGTHPDQKLALYCRSCHLAVCAMCCLMTHKLHDYVEIPVVAEESSVKLADVATRSSKYIAMLEEVAKELDNTRSSVELDFQVVRTEIGQRSITQQAKALMGKLDSFEDEALKMINSAVKENDIQKSNAMSLQSYAKTLESADHFDRAVFTPGIVEQLRSQQALPIPVVKWSLLRSETKDPEAVLGDISMTSQPDSTCSRHGGDGNIRLGRPLRTLRLQCPKISPAFVVTRGSILTVHWGDPHLWIYSLDGTFIKSCKVSNLEYAAGMALLPSSGRIKLVITNFQGALHIVTLSDKLSIKSHVTKPVSFQPRRVCMDHVTGELIVANISGKEVVILDQDANIKTRIPVGQFKIRSLWCAMKDGPGYIVVDSGSNTVVWTDHSGLATHVYGTRKGEGLHHPCHVVKDGHGRTIVVDHMGSALHLLSADRTYSHDLLAVKDGLTSPTSVFLDHTNGWLYVAHGREDAQEIRVYKYPTTTAQATSCRATLLELTVNMVNT